jgi:glycosyltransferase involved in cell wall biosynthesis
MGVDVIIPCYKYAQFLEECVESVLSQPVELRVLIIDDASPDHTPEVAQALVKRDPRIEFRRHKVNAGHISTFNEGLEWAKSSYTVLLSADDLLTPNSLARASRLLDAHPEVGFAFGRAIPFTTDEPRRASKTTGTDCPWEIVPGRRWLEDICTEAGNVVYSPEVVVRTRLQRQIGFYLPELPHTGDLEMWLRFAAHADVGIIDAEQAYYRVHSSNMHHQLGLKLSDWVHRRSAFEHLFQAHGNRIPDAAKLQIVFSRSMAWDAVWAARRAYTLRDLEFCRNLLDFAVETFPGARWWRSYVKTSLLLNLGPGFRSAVRRVTRYATR